MRYLFEEYAFDTGRREICRGADLVPVTPQVFDLLDYLIHNRERVVSKDDLINAIWNGRIVSDAALATRLNAARTALGDSGEEQRLIKTLPRKGFRFVGQVHETQQPAGATAAHTPVEPPKPALRLPDKPSIAVLPFQNMSGDPDQEYFADGIVEDIITGLSHIKWLFVIARNSTFIYKARAVDVKRVARELGVRYVLQGGVRNAGNRVRITSQLVDAETGVHLWAERYDRPLDDIFAVQDEITVSVVGAIEPSLRRAEIERVKRKRPDSLDAYDLVLQALPFAYTGESENIAMAIPLLEQALALDPGYAGAQAALAWCCHHRFRFNRGGLREGDRAAAVRHARAAIACGGDDATALALAGLVIAFDERDHATALNLFNRALSLSNSNVFAFSCSAIVLAWMGESDLAIERAQLALRLSPFDPMNFMPNNAVAIANFHAGRYEAAAAAARRAIEVNPRFSICHAHLAAALVRQGCCEEAKVEAKRVLECDPHFSTSGFFVSAGLAPAVFTPYAEALREAGLPK
ncbi:winged helix-turn-helix domain-containing tetratricopeptide repeat protein [Bradyrhizobium sp. 6(2017)]|uniref:winged helix-turn-helix domain-containing tetratricopeptide repeat protein n=1 Tax=Bradyrhizobium sp. 6(2017) TaxID=1197460 RepID=UPI0013E1DEFA|nr:winged helix-turn-helix domain-containing tetratricopeptide repeat protein [Bradyrhizobium sp. 6(2017)]QIG93480.1 transcriptional regulator [Bradyrhizobium sp. 6(2017)]